MSGIFSKNLLFNSITRFDISQSMIDDYFKSPFDGSKADSEGDAKMIQMEGGRLLSGVIDDLSSKTGITGGNQMEIPEKRNYYPYNLY